MRDWNEREIECSEIRLAAAAAGILLGIVTFAEQDAVAVRPNGNAVDAYCTENGRTPSMPFNGDCAICHNASDPSADRTPLFTAYKNGDLDAFCPPSANSPPSLQPIGPQTVSEDAMLVIDVVASDPDGDMLILEASGLPTGAAFEDLGDGAGRLVWMPTFEQAGNHAVVFKATDTGAPPESAMEEVTITVGNVNRPPVLAMIGPRTAAVDATLRIDLTATDPDGDALEFGSAGLPAAAVLTDFGDGTGEVVWMPTAGDVGSVSVTVTVTDSGLPMESDAEQFVITVGAVNQPPVLEPIGPRTAKEGETWQVGLMASDPNADALTFDCEGAPVGSVVVEHGDGTATLSGLAGFDHAGNYSVTCSVSDSAAPPASDSETFMLTIGDVNRPPVLDPIGMTKNGDSLVLRLTASDPDGNGISFEALGVPPGAEFVDHGDGTAELSWTPAAGTVGDFLVHFVASDDGTPVESTSADFTISLSAPEPTLPQIRQARWNEKRGELRVGGIDATPRGSVQIVDAMTGAAVGEAVADRNGRFRTKLAMQPSEVPCVVSARGSDGRMGVFVPVARASLRCSEN